MAFRRAALPALALAILMLLSVPGVARADGIHVVAPGETLANIATRYRVTTTAIMKANGLSNPNYLFSGQRLVIPGSSTSSGAGSSSSGSASTGSTVHIVKRGEYLSQIAARYGVGLAALASANGIRNTSVIYPGQRLVIPRGSGGGSTGSGGSTSTSGTRFVASISQQRCWLYVDSKLVGDWRCSTGRRGLPTVPGTYRVQSKIRLAYGANWDFHMPYWLGIYWAGKLENGIHGLPYTSSGARTWAGLVGTPITYGCVMLDDANARRLFEVAYVGMPVIVQR
jgi:LysM repeat protein